MEQANQLLEVNEAAAVPEYRQRHQRDIPEDYNANVFFGTTNVAGLGMMAAAAWQLDLVRPLEWLAVPFAFVFSNLVEYLVHSGPLHKKLDPLQILFTQPTQLHHD